MNEAFTLITGGTTGIGYETAKKLINNGKSVIITGQNEQRVRDSAAELKCKGVVADSADLSSINKLAKQLVDEGIRLNGLVLNAGIFKPASITDTSEAMFDQTLDINTKGVFFTLKALLPLLQNPSSVVYISSIVVNKGFETSAAYSASKAACEAFFRVANIELASQGIRCNIVRPGITATPIQAKAGMKKEDTDALFDSMSTSPLGRALQPFDHAGVIEFLLSDESIAMRNAVLGVDGGYCL